MSKRHFWRKGFIWTNLQSIIGQSQSSKKVLKAGTEAGTIEDHLLAWFTRHAQPAFVFSLRPPAEG